jgi:hypothetical protein
MANPYQKELEDLKYINPNYLLQVGRYIDVKDKYN